MSITTQKGDDGTTTLMSKERIQKDDQRIECLGVLDELIAFLGEAKTITSPFQSLVENIQKELTGISGALAEGWSKKDAFDSAVLTLEEKIKDVEKHLPAGLPKGFVIPGGSPLSAKFDICRTVCRRAERRLVSLLKMSPCPLGVLKYINRLSDLLFLLARAS